MIIKRNLSDVVHENFERYAGNVILDRAICDARDMLKPSARMLMYSQLDVSKNLPGGPFIKSARIVGDCLGHFYEHGDTSCYETYMRMAKPFAMRYPLEECDGNCGTMVLLNDEAAMRYTGMRLSTLSKYVYGGLDNNAISEWKLNVEETDKYPGVMPSIGFYNICNGTIGLGIAISSQIPQFNLKEVNTALIKLIRDPSTPDEEIIVMPDFATGATLINPEEVKKALLTGNGGSCCLRAKMTYDPATHSIHVTEIPYSVATDTIREEIAALVEANENYGVESFEDISGRTPDITIKLSKTANAKKMIAKLYRDTSLESHFTINMYVLDKGRFPKLMGLRGLFNAYIAHCIECETNIINSNLTRHIERENIIDGLIKAHSILDDVIKTIRGASSHDEAQGQLCSKFGFNEEQAKAILAMRLSSLTKLDVVKLDEEKLEVSNNIAACRHLLSTPTDLNEEIVKSLIEVMEKFGDERRTEIVTVVEPEEEEEIVINEEKEGLVLFDNNMMRTVAIDSLNEGKRGRRGLSIKPPKGANIKDTLYTTNLSTVSIFTDAGRMYSFAIDEMEQDVDYSIYGFISLQNSDEQAVALIDSTSLNEYKNIIFVTKKGLIKKSSVVEYKIKNQKGISAIKLSSDDEIVKVFFSANDNDKIMIAANNGNYVLFNQSEIEETGRMTKGVRTIKLGRGEHIADATIIRQGSVYNGVLTVSSTGRGKRTEVINFPETSRAVKGNQAIKLNDDEELSVVYAIPNEQTKVSLLAGKRAVSLDVTSIPMSGRGTKGCSLIDNKEAKDKITIM